MSDKSKIGPTEGPFEWPITQTYETTKTATGWVEAGPTCIPWYGGFAEKKAANAIARLVVAAPAMREALKDIDLRATQAKLASEIGKKRDRYRVEFLRGELERLQTVAREVLAQIEGEP